MPIGDPRAMDQESVREGILVLLLLNGGAFIAILSEAWTVLDLDLVKDVAMALVAWAVGLALAVACWLLRSMSVRHLNRAEREADASDPQLSVSSRLLSWAQALFVLSIVAFVVGSADIARNFFVLAMG